MLTRSLNTLDRMLTLNRVLDDVLSGAVAPDEARAWVPALDVVERPDAYLVALDLPGVDPAGIEIRFEQNILSIQGTKPLGFELKQDGGVRVHAAERVTGSFERSIRLPEFVDGDHITAEFDRGVLFLSVPKMKEAQARKIAIKGVESRQIQS